MVKCKSFSDAVEQEPERFVKYAFDENPRIKDFSDFNSAFRKVFDTPLGENAKIDAQDVINLFESQACKDEIRKNVDDKEYDKLYGDGIEVVRVAKTPQRTTTIIIPKPFKSHTKRGVTYNRGFKKWNPKEIHFLKVQKQKKITPKKIFTNYNARFKETPRTQSSISSKVYRI